MATKPDIIVSSATAQVEVAVEVKHGGKGWSIRSLEGALEEQLTEGYLKPATRRHGVLVISYHGQRTWRAPGTGETMSFPAVIERLQRLAATLIKNKLGTVKVQVFGINTTPDKSSPSE